MSRLINELRVLFGSSVVIEAENETFHDIDAKYSAHLSSQVGVLMELKTPQEQIDFVRSISHRDKVLICAWIMDPEAMQKILNRPV